jgi:mono/diheme cytochrome c family protein
MAKYRIRPIAFSAGVGLIAILAGPTVAAPLTYVLPDETAQLKPGPQPGFEAAQNNCAACHSADYINTQPPGKGPAFWDAEVQKMIKVYHAPVDEADAKAIADYLAKTY